MQICLKFSGFWEFFLILVFVQKGNAQEYIIFLFKQCVRMFIPKGTNKLLVLQRHHFFLIFFFTNIFRAVNFFKFSHVEYTVHWKSNVICALKTTTVLNINYYYYYLITNHTNKTFNFQYYRLSKNKHILKIYKFRI